MRVKSIDIETSKHFPASKLVNDFKQRFILIALDETLNSKIIDFTPKHANPNIIGQFPNSNLERKSS